MFRRPGKSPLLFATILPLEWFNHDKVIKDESATAALSVQQHKLFDTETGIDRLKRMLSLDDYGRMSSELNAIYQAGFLGLFAGATYGGFLGSRKAYYDFLDRNQATAFKSHLDAKKQLQNSVTVSFAKGAYRFGWRLGLFSVSYVGITTTIAVYRGKSSIFEYAAAGALTGATYKFSMGLKGMTAGTLVGGVLGSIAGGVSLLILKSTGMTMEEVRYWQYKWRTSRDDTINEAMKAQTELDPLHIHHDERFGTDKLSLNAIEPKPVTALNVVEVNKNEAVKK